MMQRWSEAYHTANPAAFPSSDTLFILVFSALMLNVDRHKTKGVARQRQNRMMTQSQFVATNNGIVDGQNVPREILCGLFMSIARTEIEI